LRQGDLLRLITSHQHDILFKEAGCEAAGFFARIVFVQTRGETLRQYEAMQRSPLIPGVHRAFIKQNRWNRRYRGTSHISFRCRPGNANI
jgi:hypothetical protein